MRPIRWSATTRLWLSLEEYSNAGLSQERMVEVIGAMRDPGSATLNLRAVRMGVNSNVIVETSLAPREPWALLDLVDWIQDRLDGELERLPRDPAT